MSKDWDRKWNKAFKPLGKPGAYGNSIAVEFEGKVYDSLTACAAETGKSIGYIKKHSKELK